MFRQKQRLCRRCGKRRSFFIFRGRARADQHHDLCPRCYRSELDRLFAWQLSQAW